MFTASSLSRPLLALLIISISACATPPGARSDAGGDGPARGTAGAAGGDAGDEDTAVPDTGAADHVAADGPVADTSAGTDSAPVDIGASNDSAAADSAAADSAPPVVADSGADIGNNNTDGGSAVACKTEPTYTGPLFVFAGGPNFGAGDGVGLCGYPNDKLPKGRFFGAVDTPLFAGAQACGACVRLENADGTVSADVQIIDLVDPLAPTAGHVLSVDRTVHDMFGAGGNPMVKYRFVPCDVSGNIQVQFDTTTIQGSSLLIMNHRTALGAVQIETVTGWKALARTSFNRWTAPFVISGKSNTVRFTDTSQRTVDATAVPFIDGLEDSGVQLPPCLLAPTPF